MLQPNNSIMVLLLLLPLSPRRDSLYRHFAIYNKAFYVACRGLAQKGCCRAPNLESQPS
jgi:hypothetical protein